MTGPYLIDTNVLLWSWHEPQKVPKRYRELLSQQERFFVSMASIWEISIKVSVGKLVTVPRVTEAIMETGFEVLPILAEHAEATRSLPLHHRDPFDGEHLDGMGPSDDRRRDRHWRA
jgi:PIN domain nuclease of toxin-antitoxin system